MPPSPLYNWICVLSSISDVLSNAVAIRSGRPVVLSRLQPELKSAPLFKQPKTQPKTQEFVQNAASEPLVNEQAGPKEQINTHRPTLQPSPVPSSRVGRLFHYGGLATSMGYGAAIEMIRRTRSGADFEQNSLVMNPANISRLVSKLTKMRGAALKLGQFLSIQDTHILPKDVEEIFRRVQDNAHYMPNWQLERVLRNSLGESWSENFVTFEPVPFAAASLGQVHTAQLQASVSPTYKEERVAVKVQFPKVRESIESDIGYLKTLLVFGRMLPPGLFLDKTLKVMREELEDECNYIREAEFASRFRNYFQLDPRFYVPWIWPGSTREVLVMEYVNGVSVGGNVIDDMCQADRDEIASRILELCMLELFEFKIMQTDPNWSNFLWNQNSRQIGLIDFGASREYSKEFMDNWVRLLRAAVAEDRASCIEWSLRLGYLTGKENEIMIESHVRSLILLTTPFRTHGLYKFEKGTEWNSITNEIRSLIPVMLKHRLTPPPRETYSLNRKLSGAFLLASRLKASVGSSAIWEKVNAKYSIDT